MRLEDCVDELFKGKKLRRRAWRGSRGYVCMGHNKLLWDDGAEFVLGSTLNLSYDDWEVCDDNRMYIPDAFWEMVDPKWNYLAMDPKGDWCLYNTCPKKSDACWQGDWWVFVTLKGYTWYKEPKDWAKTLYERPGEELDS